MQGVYRFKPVREQFLIGYDHGLAHRLQQDEFAVHFDRNRSQRRRSGYNCRIGVGTAKEVQREEETAYITKQFDSNKEKWIIGVNDAEFAKYLQNELLKQSSVEFERATLWDY
ncbi:unnamed protein product [Didymodactylos carnosus]|uniref:Coiled-coil domain-containing protein n=2 Tax=Didymodactylos carnosus TaxID=1234261 RepID=A0A815Q2T0_9BILA|nr:unnamed protein product [Didymodactylos carnosus]CAF4328664.1 unnamed protein product [Didymodactylos carnosus]